MKLDVGSADMVQDSVGISLFATKNNVKRQERGMTLLLKWRYIPQILKHRNVSSRRCQCNHSFSASQDIPNMVKPRNINTHQIDTSLGHLLKPLNHWGFADTKLLSFHRFVKCLLNSLDTKRAIQKSHKWGEEIKPSRRVEICWWD